MTIPRNLRYLQIDRKELKVLCEMIAFALVNARAQLESVQGSGKPEYLRLEMEYQKQLDRFEWLAAQLKKEPKR